MKEGSISTLFHTQPEQMATTCLVAVWKWRPTAGGVISSVTTLRQVSQCCVSCHICKWSEVPTECEGAEQRKVNHGWAKKIVQAVLHRVPKLHGKVFSKRSNGIRGFKVTANKSTNTKSLKNMSNKDNKGQLQSNLMPRIKASALCRQVGLKINKSSPRTVKTV